MIASSAFHGCRTSRLARVVIGLGKRSRFDWNWIAALRLLGQLLDAFIAAARVRGLFGSGGACVFVMTNITNTPATREFEGNSTLGVCSR